MTASFRQKRQQENNPFSQFFLHNTRTMPMVFVPTSAKRKVHLGSQPVVWTPVLLQWGLISDQSKKSELCSICSENGQLPPRSGICSLKRPFACHALRVFVNMHMLSIQMREMGKNHRPFLLLSQEGFLFDHVMEQNCPFASSDEKPMARILRLSSHQLTMRVWHSPLLSDLSQLDHFD